MKIVIVDDDIFVSGALTTILEASGKVTVAASGTDGKEAAELYKIHQPDVLLMDIRMKEKSGLDASAEILEEFPDARILLLTTFSDDEYIVKALKLGAKGYLLKQDYASILPALEAVCPVRPFLAQKSCPEFRSLFIPVLPSIMKIMISAAGNLKLSVLLQTGSAIRKSPHSFF